MRVIRLPRVYPILDSDALDRRGIALEAAAAAFLEGGAGILQLRHKGHWSRAIFESARKIAALCREAGATFVVNDRADFAMLLGAGLHVGQDDLPPRDARNLIGGEALLGFSSHNPAQLCAAGGEPVDYVALGPDLHDCIERESGPRGRRGRGAAMPRADRETAGGDRRNHIRKCRGNMGGGCGFGCCDRRIAAAGNRRARVAGTNGSVERARKIYL